MKHLLLILPLAACAPHADHIKSEDGNAIRDMIDKARKEVMPNVEDDDPTHARLATSPGVTAGAVRPEVQELIEAYQDIIDYGPLVFAKKSQWERLKAAQAKVNKEKP